MIKSVLVANRGEIACRILKTLENLGIRRGVVFTSEDHQSLHRFNAQHAYEVSSYLDIPGILHIAKTHGFEAIHPGYGFLSENAEFAHSCKAQGILFLGPRPETIHLMGSKQDAKDFAVSLKIPVIPGYGGEDQSMEAFKKAAHAIGYPIMIKAALGGGGRGMRIVEQEKDLAHGVQEARGEAQKAFGNGHLILEKYIPQARHIEVQIFGDTHGNILHLFDRDCSLQRRHQKVLEEAPAFGLDPKVRKNILETAVQLGKSCSYIGAGTVEFLVLPGGQFYFLEMNTRLQVEHPVTEMVTGIDLVALQILVGGGEPFPMKQEDVTVQGHAVEVRLCAEDPKTGFLPSLGRLKKIQFPEEVRVDTGVKSDSVIGGAYDSLLAKVIAVGETREEAFKKLYKALQWAEVEGLQTNLEFLTRLVAQKHVKSGDIYTLFLEQHLEELVTPKLPTPEVLLRAVQQVLGASQKWRPLGLYHETLELNFEGIFYTLLCQGTRDAIRVFHVQEGASINIGAVTVEPREGLLGRLNLRGEFYSFTLKTIDSKVSAFGGQDHLRSPMPGKISAVLVEVNQHVTQGMPLVILEAMKMEHSIKAPLDGVITRIYFKVGDLVEEGATLIEMGEMT